MRSPSLRRLGIAAALLTTAVGQAAAADAAPRIGFSTHYPLSYDGWESAFLSGNGKMGIMVFGNPLAETVVYNDRGFNLAQSQPRSFAQVSAADLETIRSECAAGDFADADKLASASAQYKGGGEGARHPGYKMSIAIPADGDVTGYSRACDFRTGEITVKWTDNRGDWVRKAFVSRKDNVTVQSLAAPTRGTLTCAIELGTDPGMGLPKEMAFTTGADGDFLDLRMKYRPTLDLGYEGVTRYVVVGGTHTLEGAVLKVSGAKAVLLLTRTAKYYEQCETQWARRDLQKALADLPADYDALLRGHLALHQAIYDRVRLDLDADPAERAKTNEELLAAQKDSPLPNKALWERVFDAGRYYFLSSSSELTPPDLCGIWTGNCKAGWGGYYHLDANLNLQIGGGNIGDMPEAMEGYFKINEDWRSDFEVNARKLLGCRGMVAAGNTPNGRAGLMASINDYYPYQYATGEEGWLLYPFWEHYLITGDTEFLKNRLYPLLKDMGYFYEDFLTKTDGSGKYILAGSVSPENQPSNLKISLVNNSTFDISGAKFCLTALLETCRLLNLDQGPGGEAQKWAALLDKLPPYLVNDDGALAEWSWPGLKDNYHHRHSSQLLPVWPYREVTPETTPELYKAALVTAAKKDEANYGTGHGWLHSALIAAGLKNGEAVNTKLLWLTQNDFYFDSLCTSHNAKHEIFCTDICNTVPDIFMEMLVSSSPGVLELLPALPATLPRGSISGVKGRNRLTVQSLGWNAAAGTADCVLKSDIDQQITLIERSGIADLKSDAPSAPSPLGPIARLVTLKAGMSTPIALRLGKLRAVKANLALGQPVTASSTADDCPAANAVDGVIASRWASAHQDDQWITVDLGAPHKITEVKLDWETSAAKDYAIEVSDDAQAWMPVRTVTGNAQTDWLAYPDLNAQGRYVRIDCKTRITKYGFSLRELQVFGE